MALKRGFFLILGLCSLVLGLLGILLPILPTVPFILLAAYCFARSSDRLYQWLMSHPWFADALKNWQAQGAIRKSLKKKAYIVSSLSFLTSIVIVPLIWVKVMLACLGTGLILYLRSIPEIDG
ncbi:MULTISPECIES: YbaN family protein [unclassified Shewanella]|uniref:YbaN family protein n=1 Tax=unclassified Shewanella TaxID=196818 RepID=UPI001BC2CB4A|nr:MULTISPECIES: YbaN family protein [unclassified Shewanella]GIU15421.1 inner membrane protein [Shewanella sp. MBTL60-112-B1]GIU34874.1 inner membrane protein [Shewanella sp. MBTL60-112-B2]